MQRDYPRGRAWRGRDEEMELWGREMDHDDWLRGTYGPGGMPQRRPPRGDWGQDWWRQPPSDRDYTPRWYGRTSARGYRRSDERIREDVYDRLMEHPFLDSSDVEITVHNAEVTIEGTVSDRWEKRLAEDLAESVAGVIEVHNRLRSTRREAAPLPTTEASRQTTGGPPLRRGMQVVGVDGEPIGHVKELRGDEFLIDRPMARDVYAPMQFVQNMVGDQVVLGIPAGQVDHMRWRTAEIMGAPPPMTGTTG
jgi:HSP20 family molecular chaperone IbpA